MLPRDRTSRRKAAEKAKERTAARKAAKAAQANDRAGLASANAAIAFVGGLGHALIDLTLGRPTPRLKDQPSNPRARGRDTSVRTPRSRAAKAAGAASGSSANGSALKTIHFRHKALCKGLSPDGTAAAHHDYLTRDNAPDQLSLDAQTADPEAQRQAALHTGYLEREGAVDVGLPPELRQEGPNRPEQQLDGLAVFGNIGATSAECRHFWDAVTAKENIPGNGSLRVYCSQEDWAALLARPDAPAILASAKPMQYRQPPPGDDGIVGQDDSPPPVTRGWRFSLQHADGAAAVEWLKKNAPQAVTLRHEPGRGGRIQFRIEAELPHELSSAQRYALVLDFIQTFEKRGLPYFAVIHRPDVLKNDPRNWHLHLDYYDRPCKRDPKTGLWDIETIVLGPDRHPSWDHVPNKDRDVNNRSWIPGLRKQFTEITNRHLRLAGLSKTYTHLSYAAAGIDAVPGEHLGPRAAALHKKGIDTDKAALAAQRVHAAIDADCETAYASFLERRSAQLIKLGFRADRPANVPAIDARVDELSRIAQLDADLYKRRKRNRALLAATIGQPMAQLNRLQRDIAQKEQILAERPHEIHNPRTFNRYLHTARERFVTLTASIEIARAEADKQWAALETEYAAAEPRRARAKQLLADLHHIRRGPTKPPSHAVRLAQEQMRRRPRTGKRAANDYTVSLDTARQVLTATPPPAPTTPAPAATAPASAGTSHPTRRPAPARRPTQTS